MSNFSFTPTDSNAIGSFRAQFFQTLTAPIDAMWEQLYIGGAQDFLIEAEGSPIGYCCIDKDNNLNQLFLIKESQRKMKRVVADLIKSGLVHSASLSSNEPVAFNACLLHAQSVKANTFCYQHPNQKETKPELPEPLRVNSPDEIPALKAFFKEQVGMDDTFGYTEGLSERRELYVMKKGDTIIATNECKESKSQSQYVDLGVIVRREFQGQGLATLILRKQVDFVLEVLKKQPICSTTVDNIASQKAIEKAGFYCSNIIFDLSFEKA